MINKRKNLTLLDSGRLFAMVIFAPALISIILAYMFNNKGALSGDARYWFLAFLSQAILFVCAFGYASKQKIALPTAVGMKNKLKLWQVALIVVLAFALLCFNLPIQNALQNLLHGCGFNMTTTSSMPVIDNIGKLLLSILLVAFLPAFCEEVVYRGFVCNTLARPGTRMDWKAVLASAFLFCIMHQDPLKTIHPFIIGVAMAIVYLSTRSIWASIIFHFSNNTFVLVLDYIFAGGFEEFVVGNWWWVMIVTLAVSVAILWMFAKNAKVVDVADEQILQERKTQLKKAMPCFVAAIAFCILMWVLILVG